MGDAKTKITPAGYPESSFKESDSVQCLQSLIKNKYIKPHINVDDKIPNHDGHIEILDDNRIPKGRVTVQIKTIPKGRMQYSCNMKYVSYSETISEPFLMICVDVSNNKAYWRHIEPVMPEIKEGQAFFTIYFSDTDAIDDTENYIQQWLRICTEYKERISNYPILKKKLTEKEQLPDGAFAYQQMIDYINSELDTNWKTIKSKFFASTWKIGIGIYDNTVDYTYLLYQVPYGETGTIVRKLTKDDDKYFDNKEPTFISKTWHSHFSYTESRKHGFEFIQKYVKMALSEYKFVVQGKILSSEIITAFCRHYADALEVDTNISLNAQDVYGKIMSRFFNYQWLNEQSTQIKVHSILGRIRVVMKNVLVNTIYSPHTPWPDNKLSIFPLSSLQEALRYMNMASIVTSLPPPDIISDHEHPILGFSDDAEKKRAIYIADNFLTVYEEFITGNGLNFINPPFLNPRQTIIFVYAPRPNKKAGENRRYVTSLTAIRVDNKDAILPRYTLIIKNSDDEISKLLKDGNIFINRKRFKCLSWHGLGGECLYSSMPLFTLTYAILKSDIESYFRNQKTRL